MWEGVGQASYASRAKRCANIGWLGSSVVRNERSEPPVGDAVSDALGARYARSSRLDPSHPSLLDPSRPLAPHDSVVRENPCYRAECRGIVDRLLFIWEFSHDSQNDVDPRSCSAR